ncbi:MAG: peptide antibiotic transporter SbmA [Pseudomonadota bacterium]
MFRSFFPKPQLFLLTAFIWALACILFWYLVAAEWSEPLGVANLLGVEDRAVWLYQFVISCYAIFALTWLRFAPHEWGQWSVFGTVAIIFVTWFQVQIDVSINDWYGDFYNIVQSALNEPGSITPSEYYASIATFLKLAMIAITVHVLTNFGVKHYVFRWRTAMNNHYMEIWDKVRHIEGASQRIQEDCMRFAELMERIGKRTVDAMMTLVAFLPLLWVLSDNIPEIPIIGELPKALVWIAVIWSLFGTGLLALVGIRLPGLEFRNQRVEAAYRKELVLGEDDAARAQPPTWRELFQHVRKNYFRLYFNYMYFDVFRYGYLQFGVMVPMLAMGPSIIAGSLTFGLWRQILNAFDRVESSIQFLVHSWTSIVELMSIYKRLRAFEAAIAGDEQAAIEFEAGGMTRPAGE